MLFVIFSSFLLIFSLSLYLFIYFFQFDYCVSHYVPSWLILNRSLDFLDWGDCLLSHVKQVFGYSVFRHFHGPFSFSCPFGDPLECEYYCF